MTEINCRKEYARYASMNVLGMLGISCYILADTFFVSKGLGAEGLAALNLAIPIYNFIHGCGLMVGMGAATRYSIQQSQGKGREANLTFTNALILALIFAVFFMIAGIGFSGEMIAAMGGSGKVHAMASLYLRVIMLFSPAFIMNNVVMCFIRNDGAPHLSMAAMTVGSFTNIVLDWVFIFPMHMGIFGAVLATVFSPIIGIAIMLTHVAKGRNQFHLVYRFLEAGVVKGIFFNGLPSLITELSSGVVMIVFNMIILRLEGNIGVAAYGVIANLSLVVLAIYTGIAQGIQPIISRNYGAGNYKDIRSVFRYAIVTMLVLSGIIYTGFFFGAAPITRIFNSEHNQTLQMIAEEGLKLYFIACPFAGFNIINSMYFTSMARPHPAQAVSLLRGFFVIIPLTVLMAMIWKIRGVWSAFPVTELIVTVLGIFLYWKYRERSRVTEG